MFDRLRYVLFNRPIPEKLKVNPVDLGTYTVTFTLYDNEKITTSFAEHFEVHHTCGELPRTYYSVKTIQDYVKEMMTGGYVLIYGGAVRVLAVRYELEKTTKDFRPGIPHYLRRHGTE